MFSEAGRLSWNIKTVEAVVSNISSHRKLHSKYKWFAKSCQLCTVCQHDLDIQLKLHISGDEAVSDNVEDVQLLAYHFYIPEDLCGKMKMILN